MADIAYRILIIDDDSFLLDMYSLKFKSVGHAVEVALGSEEGLAKLRAGFKPDIILSDIVMPGMDGFQLLEAIRNEKLAEGAVIIMLSNRGERDDTDRAKRSGADAYIVKARTIPSEVLEQVLAVAGTRHTSVGTSPQTT